MKNTMKFAALLTALLIAAPLFAQKVNEKQMTRAKDRIENMCQTVKVDDATKQKAVDLTYNVFAENGKLDAQKKKSELSEDDYKAAVKKNTDEYWKNLQSLMPKDQLAAYKAWKSIPGKERDAAPNK